MQVGNSLLSKRKTDISSDLCQTSFRARMRRRKNTDWTSRAKERDKQWTGEERETKKGQKPSSPALHNGQDNTVISWERVAMPLFSDNRLNLRWVRAPVQCWVFGCRSFLSGEGRIRALFYSSHSLFPRCAVFPSQSGVSSVVCGRRFRSGPNSLFRRLSCVLEL